MTANEGSAARLGDISSLVAFGPGMPEQERADIQNLLLDAQLFASHVYDFKSQWTTWMHYYRNRLQARGLRRKSLVMDDSLLISSTEDLMQATFRITGTEGREQLGQLVRRSFDAMGVYEAAEAYFQQGYDQGRLGSFQIVPCARFEPDQSLLLLCGLHLNTDGFSAGGRRLLFYFKGGSYVFDGKAYAAYREDVSRYLATKANALIQGVQI
jgi:hypothetical protein